MASISELQGWKSDLEELAVEKAKAEGRLEQALNDLKKAGFDTVEAAKKERDRLYKEKERLESKAEELLKQFNTKYEEFIER